MYEKKLILEEGKERLWISKQKSIQERANFILLDNVQFIYELALSQLELEAFGVRFELCECLREFRVVNELNDAELLELRKRLAYFKSINGEYTDYFYIINKNVTRSVNQYLTHWIYPYKGKFHPQMIRALLNIIGLSKGDTVLDPFVGSGTTALEAQLLGINCIGIDISPLCVLQSKVKTQSLDVLQEILDLKDRVATSIERNFYNLNGNVLDKTIASIDNDKVKNFYIIAKLIAVSDNVRRKRDFAKSFIKNLNAMIKSVKDYAEVVRKLDIELGKVDIRIGDARCLPLESNSIDGIITSPPYSIALDYIANDAHALKELGCSLEELREKLIGVRGLGQERINFYNEDMKKSLKEMYRVLKPGKYAVIIIGNATYQGKEVKTVEFITDYASKIGFELVRSINKIIFGLYNVMQRENILIFKKG